MAQVFGFVWHPRHDDVNLLRLLTLLLRVHTEQLLKHSAIIYQYHHMEHCFLS